MYIFVGQSVNKISYLCWIFAMQYFYIVIYMDLHFNCAVASLQCSILCYHMKHNKYKKNSYEFPKNLFPLVTRLFVPKFISCEEFIAGDKLMVFEPLWIFPWRLHMITLSRRRRWPFCSLDKLGKGEIHILSQPCKTMLHCFLQFLYFQQDSHPDIHIQFYDSHSIETSGNLYTPSPSQLDRCF